MMAESKNNELNDIDDLDDLLDDALGDFSKLQLEEQSTEKGNSEVKAEPIDFEADFAEQLTLGMEDLLKQVASGEDITKSLNQLHNASQSMENPSSSTTRSQPTSFQDSIESTINKLQSSSDQAKGATNNDENPEALLEQLMKQMEGMADSPDFEKAIEGMMGQIMTKDLLYEPMKDLHEKYPQWLEENKEKLSEEELTNYTKQNKIVSEIIELFDAQECDDKGEPLTNETNNALQLKVMGLMHTMQDLGQPPAELLKLISPDMEIDAEGQPKLPKELEECNVM